MHRLVSFSIFILLSGLIFGQEVRINSDLEGYWTGSFIRNGNSTQTFSLDIVREGDSLRGEFRNKDWTFYEKEPSQVTENGRQVEFSTPYGKVTVVRDSVYGEMVGESRFALVHMKRSLRPPSRKIEREKLIFDLGDIRIEGELTHPAGPGPWPTAILVHGRGCLPHTIWSERSELFSQYGLAVITYDNRGYEATGFPCEKTTMNLRSADLVKIVRQASDRDEVGPVGLITNSAGGWVAPKAAAEGKLDLAFMVTVVGPSTSVQDQQLDCCKYYIRNKLGLGQKEIDEAVQYMELSFSDRPDKKVFPEMMALLDSADAHGWRDVLDDDDVPPSLERMNELWVRRNKYDPAKDLQAFRGPFLSMLGGDDNIAPYRESLARFQELFDAVGKKNYRIVVMAGAGHGLEHRHLLRDLGYESELGKWYTYWKFDRVAPGAADEIIQFLRDYGIID
jgi:pimeloyl-ACP methyl ester carboxylesterase